MSLILRSYNIQLLPSYEVNIENWQPVGGCFPRVLKQPLPLVGWQIDVHLIWRRGPSWSWLYGSWIYNYLCNQCLSPLKLWVWAPFMARCSWYNIMWSSLSVTCDRWGGFLKVLWFPPPIKWPPRYNWNIVESGV